MMTVKMLMQELARFNQGAVVYLYTGGNESQELITVADLHTEVVVLTSQVDESGG